MTDPYGDPYAILGLTPHATASQINRAYHALLRQHHPDTRSTDHAQTAATSDAFLQDILTAYRLLRDPARRAKYEQLRGLATMQSAPRTIPVRRAHPSPSADLPIKVGPVLWHGPVTW
jgi:curved DNA-binding protein CbpA